MTVSANVHPQGSFPPPLSLAALFGFRSSPQPSWRYEPPSLPKNAGPLDLPLDPPPPPPSFHAQPPLPQASASTSSPHQPVTPLSFPPTVTENGIPETEAATISSPETDTIKAAPGTISTSPPIFADPANNQHQIVCLVVRAGETSDLFADAEHALSCIPQAKICARVPAITWALAKGKGPEAYSFNSPYVRRIDVWLRLLYRLDLRPASVLPSESLVGRAIAPLTKLTFTKQIRPEALMKALLISLVQKGALKGVSIEEVFDLVAACASLSKPRGSCPIDQLLEKVVLQMQAMSLPYGGLLELALPLVARHARMDSILEFLNMMEDQGLHLNNRAFIDKLVKENIATAQRPDANVTEKQCQHNAFRLRICQRIQDVLARLDARAYKAEQELVRAQARRQFQNILDRAKDAHALPLVYRNLTADTPTDQRVDLVHQLAHRYSLDKTRTHRECWRSMYYLYRFLLQYSLPIGPLFTKAIVYVSLIRPLSENRFVSARRLIWVCHVVARVEGEDVARDIENVFWHWRGDLIRHAKTVYVGVGGNVQDKAHIGTMKKLGLI